MNITRGVGRSSSNGGFTLIELLVYSALMVVVLLIAGGFLINTMKAQRTVDNATQASNSGQLVTRSVGHGVRNASSLWHSPAGAVPEVIMARTMRSDSAGTWFCQAWAYDNGSVRTTTSTSAISTNQTSTTVATWTLLGDGMQRVSAGTTPVFTVTGRQVDLILEAKVEGGKAVLVRTSAVTRQPNAAIGASPKCFP
ncbi:PulJ/GspJ family protein [Cryobacterium psychrophilum]|uniref:Type II secretion system protein n=1 Tax=Cryobacterium psychrophilum TaxID=41988 RepID=A0A4Y8KXU5_9MICO|nr:type II secretion system protein [Cryobacterium psychrophilum]TDW29730.1 pilin/secretion family protein with methylation motif [Cryobacterium psychrophilum]TFD81836.1 type II secretion system protein [Cryobacterium psychrophilum]